MSFAPTVANGVVYVGINDGNNGFISMNAFDAATGNLLWSDPGYGSYFAPAVDNEMVFSGAADGNLYAFHLSGTTSKSKTKRTTKKR